MAKDFGRSISMKIKSLILSVVCVFASYTVCSAVDYTGMWWDTGKQGSGVYIDFTEGPNAVCGSWYLYDERGNPLWLTFLGKVDRNTLTTSLYSFTGPSFGSAWDSSLVRGENVGSITIDFSNPDELVMNYDIDRVTGTYHLSRFSSESCVGSLWWDVAKQGQGVTHFHFPGSQNQDQTGLVWYVYDTAGNPVWYTATGAEDADTFTAWRFTGPPLGQAWDQSLVKAENAGTIKFVFDQGSLQGGINQKVLMDFQVEGVSGHLNLEPFICPIAVDGDTR